MNAEPKPGYYVHTEGSGLPPDGQWEGPFDFDEADRTAQSAARTEGAEEKFAEVIFGPNGGMGKRIREYYRDKGHSPGQSGWATDRIEDILIPEHDNFDVVYPCFIPLVADGGYMLGQVADHRCVMLLTDKDLVERFFRQRYPNQANITVRVETLLKKEGLLIKLKGIQAAADEQGEPIYLAIDPTGQRKVPSVTVAQFIQHLESQPD